jgi:hypothetical protein
MKSLRTAGVEKKLKKHKKYLSFLPFLVPEPLVTSLYTFTG